MGNSPAKAVSPFEKALVGLQDADLLKNPFRKTCKHLRVDTLKSVVRVQITDEAAIRDFDGFGDEDCDSYQSNQKRLAFRGLFVLPKLAGRSGRVISVHEKKDYVRIKFDHNFGSAYIYRKYYSLLKLLDDTVEHRENKPQRQSTGPNELDDLYDKFSRADTIDTLDTCTNRSMDADFNNAMRNLGASNAACSAVPECMEDEGIGSCYVGDFVYTRAKKYPNTENGCEKFKDHHELNLFTICRVLQMSISEITVEYFGNRGTGPLHTAKQICIKKHEFKKWYKIKTGDTIERFGKKKPYNKVIATYTPGNQGMVGHSAVIIVSGGKYTMGRNGKDFGDLPIGAMECFKVLPSGMERILKPIVVDPAVRYSYTGAYSGSHDSEST